MVFNSFSFLWTFPIIFIVYWGVVNWNMDSFRKSKVANYFLIFISYLLYFQWKPIYALVLLGITIITYIMGLWIEKYHGSSKNKYILWIGILLSLTPLFLFKYYNFISSSIADGLKTFGIQTGLPGLNWAMPLGLSFFTLQAIGYVIDVYYRRIKAEKNWWNYCLFICFFPQIVSGPISKAADLLPQINSSRIFNYNQSVQGLKWILWGLFLKVVVADRLGIVADSIFNNYQYYSGLFCLIGSILYSFQIYGDFAGYSFMAVGIGYLMGFSLINNFNCPYFAQSITEFWHRWHISLSIWLRDYIYIPLGGSRCGKLRNYFNIIITFLVSGIWHGANWTFILWGGIHGLFQVVEKYLGINKSSSTSSFIKLSRICATFLIVNFAWIFFRMPEINDAFLFIKKIFTDIRLAVDIEIPTFFGCILLIIIVLFKDFADEKNIKHLKLLHSPSVFIRWSTYVLLIIAILTFGIFDASQFIYAMF